MSNLPSFASCSISATSAIQRGPLLRRDQRLPCTRRCALANTKQHWRRRIYPPKPAPAMLSTSLTHPNAKVRSFVVSAVILTHVRAGVDDPSSHAGVEDGHTVNPPPSDCLNVADAAHDISSPACAADPLIERHLETGVYILGCSRKLAQFEGCRQSPRHCARICGATR